MITHISNPDENALKIWVWVIYKGKTGKKKTKKKQKSYFELPLVRMLFGFWGLVSVHFNKQS